MTKDPKRLEDLAARLGISVVAAKTGIEKVKSKFGNMSGDDILDLVEQWEALWEMPKSELQKVEEFCAESGYV